MTTFISTPCLEYKDAIRELCITECSAFGVVVKCESCKKPWSKALREWFFKNLKKAQQEVEDVLGSPICPTEICREKVYLCYCPTNVQKRPIAYIGKKELVESRTLSICYQELSDCGAELPISITPLCTEENDLIGVIDIMGVPEHDFVVFKYTDFLCYNTEQVLQQPECLTPMICDEVLYGYEAIWPKCHLLHPNCQSQSINKEQCFLDDVVVEFWKINEDLAVEIPGKCNCGGCTETGCTGYTVTVGDALKGEVCIEGSGCGCNTDDYVYLNYATAHNCGDPDENINTLISLIALIRRGEKRLCDCDGGNDYIDWLLELDPSFSGNQGSPFDTAKNFPWGKTRAGVIVKRLLDEITQRMIANGQLRTTSGGMVKGYDYRTKPFKGGRRW